MRLVKLYMIALCWFCKISIAQFYFNNRYDNFGSCDGYGTISNYQGQYLGTGNSCNSISYFSLNVGLYNYIGTNTLSKTYSKQGSNFQSTFSKNIYMPNTDFIVGGSRFYHNDTSLVFLWRFNSNLDSIKYTEYGYLNKTNYVSSIVEDGKYIYMAGSTDSLYTNTQMLLIKTDTSGNEIWKKKIGLVGWDETAWCIKMSSDGKLLISGNKRAHNGTINGAYILKVDTSGAVMWQQYFWSNQGLAATALVELPNTDIVAIAGKGYGGNTRMELIKLDAAGNLIFDKEYGSFTDRAEPYAMIMNDKGNLVAVGQNYYPSLGGKVNGLMYEFNQNGDSLFSREYAIQPGSQNYFRDIVQAPDKGYCFSGFISPLFANGGTGNQDIWLLKTDSTFCESAVSCGYPTNLVSSSEVENILKVYPNPAKDILYIDLGEAYKNTTLQIYNAVGDLVLTEHLTTQNSSLPTHHLTSGLYYYNIKQPNAPNFVGKITVLK